MYRCIVTVEADPCLMNTVMDNAWRDITTAPITAGARCDNTLATNWYRLKLNGADAILPTDAIGVNRCGTLAPIWFNGEYLRPSIV